MSKSLLFLVAGVSAIAVACTSSSSMGPSANTATVNFSMIDAPFRLAGGTVTAVNIALVKVELIGTGGPQVVATYSPDKIVNLLDFQTTPFAIGTAVIPAGTFQQVRLVLDTASTATTITVNGTTFPLEIPSATGPLGFGGNTSVDNGDGPGTAGIKVNIHLEAQGGFTYGFLIDFNAAESVVLANGRYILKPVLIATPIVTSGTIAGTVTNSTNSGAVVNAQVVAEQGGSPVNSGVTDSAGHYQINALPAGTYTVVVKNSWTSQGGMAMTATNGNGPGPFTVNNVVVTAGQVTTVNVSE